MLAALGFATIAIFLFAIMTKRVSVLVALILIPTVAGLVAGFGTGLGKMMLEGITRVAPVGVMIIFAVLYFGLMLDVGLFEPMIKRLLRFVKGDPLKVALATAVLTMAVSLDGDGATTFLITISAMLPLYQRLGMNRLVLSGIVCLGAGVMNIIPWGGPTVRAMAALKAELIGHIQSGGAGDACRYPLGAVCGVHFRTSGAGSTWYRFARLPAGRASASIAFLRCARKQRCYPA